MKQKYRLVYKSLDIFSPRKGFTLIELLISIGVFSIIAGIAITIFVALNASYDKAAVIRDLNHEGNRVMETISRSIKNATRAEEVSSQRLRLLIPREEANLEYSTNGQCTQIEIYYDSATQSIRKESPSTAGICDATPLCPVADPCILTSDEVAVIALSFAVTNNDRSPDVVKITFNLQQSASLADPEQQSSQQFQRVVLTRGY